MMDTILHYIKEKESVKREEKECKGRFYRGRVCTYIQEGRIVERKEVVLLKRISCPGCQKCDWMEDVVKKIFRIPMDIIVLD